MLKDEIHAVPEYSGTEDTVRKSAEPFHGIGRIGKNQVEAFRAYPEEIKDIVPDHPHVAKAKGSGGRLDESGICRSHLHTIYLRCPAGCEFKGDCPGAAEQVKHRKAFEFILAKSVVGLAL